MVFLGEGGSYLLETGQFYTEINLIEQPLLAHALRGSTIHRKPQLGLDGSELFMKLFSLLSGD